METEDNLIQKHLRNELNDSELEELSRKLQEDEQFRLEFQAQVKQEFLVDQWRLQESRDAKLHRVEQSGLFHEERVRSIYSGWKKYAAAVVFVLLCGYAVLQLTPKRSEIYEDEIVLTLSDGTMKTISEDSQETFSEQRGKQVIEVQNNTLTYQESVDGETEVIAFNELEVPAGKRYHIRLSDGTLVFVNSGSHLRYPVNIHRQNSREVFLSGEAYFEVVKDSLHPFVVHANSELDVRVLGTHFDVRAYADDATIKTTLAEGKVEVSLTAMPDIKAILAPGEAASWAKDDQKLEVAAANMDNEMAWIQNKLLFIDEPFAEVRKKIERSYGVQIQNELPELDSVRFNGDFDIETETIEDVLSAFSATGYFNYTKQNNVITIRK
ncbi:FecR family protein [Sunxiuqinia indica]|uniref:FecR family protein n=1 Tax=Sunxiuqinia indica TaxID=2692584 RepID=UPI001357F25B|nr:FecR domain-containing protein [Sunxiuqinia indica]